jgi:hypothetical protein
MRKKNYIDKPAFENWHKPEYEEDPDNAPKTFSKPPIKYEQNFLEKIDKRTDAYQLLNSSYQEVIADLGGIEGLSHVQKSLAERYCFLEYILMIIELRIANEPKKSAKLVSKWVQATNSFIGLSKTIGLERRTKKVVNLKAYVESKK